MSLVPAKCPECGGNINIDSGLKATVCEFCKQPFIVEEAINNFNATYNITNNVTNNIKADTVIINEQNDRKVKLENKYNQYKIAIENGIDNGRDTYRAFESCITDYRHVAVHENPMDLNIQLQYFNMLYEALELALMGFRIIFNEFEEGYLFELKRVTNIVKVLDYPKYLMLDERVNNLVARMEKFITSDPVFLKELNDEKVVTLEEQLKDIFRNPYPGQDSIINSLVFPILRNGWLPNIKAEVEKIEKEFKLIKDPDINRHKVKCTIYGHYFIYGDDDSVKYVHVLKEPIWSEIEMREFVEKINNQYISRHISRCRSEKICPICGDKLNTFGRCKKAGCSNMNKKVFSNK